MHATRNRGCMMCAPTGVAAFNIGGRTLHSALAIPVDQKNYGSQLVAPLQGDQLTNLQRLFEDVEYLIIDEISMVSDAMLAKVNIRLNQIKCTQEQLDAGGMYFGNISVIVIGDFYQLQPVKANYVFDRKSVVGWHLWTMFALHDLTENVRQRGDSAWSQILNRIRTGDATDDDMIILRSRLTRESAAPDDRARAQDDTLPPWNNALRIFSKRKQCDAYNKMKSKELMRAAGVDVHRCDAVHAIVQAGVQQGMNSSNIPNAWIPKSDDDCGGLPSVLFLGTGSRVMLRRNIRVHEGLVNGASGMVTGFEWPDGVDRQPGLMPTGVYVRFDNRKVGVPVCAESESVPVRDDANPEDWPSVLISQVHGRFEAAGNSGVVLQRTQIPLVLCWAATVHKVQGITLDRAIVDLKKPWMPALAYVALSRVSTLNGLLIRDLGPKSLVSWAHASVTDEYNRLRYAITWNTIPSAVRQTMLSTDRLLQAYHANATKKYATDARKNNY
jgi:ATP-dependent exoDNAse (exonuclease V) alpha subunit